MEKGHGGKKKGEHRDVEWRGQIGSPWKRKNRGKKEKDIFSSFG